MKKHKKERKKERSPRSSRARKEKDEATKSDRTKDKSRHKHAARERSPEKCTSKKDGSRKSDEANKEAKFTRNLQNCDHNPLHGSVKHVSSSHHALWKTKISSSQNVSKPQSTATKQEERRKDPCKRPLVSEKSEKPKTRFPEAVKMPEEKSKKLLKQKAEVEKLYPAPKQRLLDRPGDEATQHQKNKDDVNDSRKRKSKVDEALQWKRSKETLSSTGVVRLQEPGSSKLQTFKKGPLSFLSSSPISFKIQKKPNVIIGHLKTDSVHTDVYKKQSSDLSKHGFIKTDPSALKVIHKHISPKPAEVQPQDIFIVLDTNILLSHLEFVKKIRSHGLGALGFPKLLIPWVVLQELDALKSGKLSKDVESKARPAVDYIYTCLKKQCPRLSGQSMQQASHAANGLNTMNNDDRVLQCCLQYQALFPGGAIILCTNDKNLCNKALLSGVKAFNKTDLKEQGEVKTGPLKLPSSSLLVSPAREEIKAGQVKTPHEEEQLSRREAAFAERELSESLAVLENSLQPALSAVLEEEMKDAFGDLWTEIVYVKPPWTLDGLLQCFRKHWISVFGNIINRSLHSRVETLSNCLCTDASVERSSILRVMHAAKELLNALRNRSSYGGQVDLALSCIKTLHHRLQGQPQKTSVEDTSDGDTLMTEAVEDVLQPSQALCDEVWSLFESIWNNLCHVRSALFSALQFSPDSMDSVPSCSTSPPQDALSCLHRLSTAIEQLLAAFQRVLSAESTVEDAQSLLNFIYTSEITAMKPCFTAKDLFECLSQQEYREKLLVGGSQLMELKANLDHCALAVCGASRACS